MTILVGFPITRWGQVAHDRLQKRHGLLSPAALELYRSVLWLMWLGRVAAWYRLWEQLRQAQRCQQEGWLERRAGVCGRGGGYCSGSVINAVLVYILYHMKYDPCICIEMKS